MAMTDKRLNFNFSEEYILEDNFIKIIPLEEKHIDPLFEISNDPFIWTYFFDKGDTYQKLTNYIRLALENQKNKRSIRSQFLIKERIDLQVLRGFTNTLPS